MKRSSPFWLGLSIFALCTVGRAGQERAQQAPGARQPSERAPASDQFDAEPQPPVRKPPFSKRRFESLLTSRSEKSRQLALSQLEEFHAGRPELPGLLIDALQTAVAGPKLWPSSLEMIRLLNDTGGPEVTDAMLRLLAKSAARDDAARCTAELTLALTERGCPDVVATLVTALDKQIAARRVSPATAATVEALGMLDSPAAADALSDALQAEDWRVAVLAADALSRRQRAEDLEAVKKLIGRSEFPISYGFRHRAVAAVSRFGRRESIDVLIELLPALDGQLKYDVVRHLSGLLEQPFGGDARQWATWWKANRQSFRYPNSLGETSGNYRWDYPVPRFYGHALYAKRVVFVIDCSTSMTRRNLGSRLSRLEQAKLELAAAVRQLPADAAFNIIFFYKAVRVWQRESVPATDRNKTAALSWVRRLAPGKGTNIYDALGRSFQVDLNAEAIYLLSDGRPTQGRITDPAEIVQATTAANAFRCISINTVALGGGNALMKELAEKNNGQYRLSR